MPARWIDVSIGLSALTWAVLALVGPDGVWGAHPDASHPTLVRVAIAALNATVGVLFLVRRESDGEGSARQIAAALPSMLLGGLAYRLSSAQWPLAFELLFCVGALGAVATLAVLGRSFAILPARREVVARGPYAWVRHPTYAFELLMVASAAFCGAWGLLLVPLAFASLALRVRAEEEVLGEDPAYAAYRARVTARLVPYLY